MNKIVMFAMPAAAFSVMVLPDFESNEQLDSLNIFYEQMSMVIPALVNEYSVDEVMVVGPNSYVEKIGKELADSIPSNEVTVIITSMGEMND